MKARRGIAGLGKWLSLGTLWAAASLIGGAAWAQDSGLVIEPTPGPVACLTSTQPQRKTPDFPGEAQPGQAAVLRAKMRFTRPDEGPSVEFGFNNGGERFAKAVRDFVANYRVPCLAPGDALTATQEFQFVMEPLRLRTLTGAARDDDDDDSKLSAECRAAVTANAPPPSYPGGSLTPDPRRPDPGTVLVRMTFVAPDQPPAVSILYDGGSGKLASAVRASVEAYRIPCTWPGGKPLTTSQEFRFRFEGQEAAQLQPELPFVKLLLLVKDLQAQRVRFDFTTMGCPFEVQLKPYQPYARNRVREVGAASADRREFIEWLRNVTLEIPPRAMKTAIGEPTIVKVPCLVLDLS